jgi:hypothetical protein
MFECLLMNFPPSSQLIFGAIGTVAYSTYLNLIPKEIKLDKPLIHDRIYSRSMTMCIFAVIIFIGLISLFLVNGFFNLTGWANSISFLIFNVAIWWILIVVLRDIAYTYKLFKPHNE